LRQVQRALQEIHILDFSGSGKPILNAPAGGRSRSTAWMYALGLGLFSTLTVGIYASTMVEDKKLF
jgi:hypothetical protein